MKLTVEQVRECRTPQEALLVLATAIDQLRCDVQAPSPWAQPLEWDDPELHKQALTSYPPDDRAVIEGDDVIVKPVSPERQEARESFAIGNRLQEFYGNTISPHDFITAYIKGGPRWLYYTNRECVMQMPYELRRALVADVHLDSPSEAAEISRDILKSEDSMPEDAQVSIQRARLGKAGA